MKKIKKILTTIFSTCLLTTVMCSTVFAYSLYKNGYVSKSIPIEERTSYTDETYNARWAWTDSGAGVSIYAVSGSGGNVIVDEQVAEEWNGQYDPVKTNWSGRATKFKITINRTICVNEGSSFKQSVICHEFGHALRLADQPDSSSCIMGYERDRNSMVTPQQDDIDGVLDAF